MRSNVDAVTGSLTVRDGARRARATLLRVPGRDGRGAYMGEVCIAATTDETPLRVNIAESIRDLGDALDRHGFHVRPLSLPARLVYGGAWAPGALESQIGYDMLRDPKTGDACRRFFNLLWANLPGHVLLKPVMLPSGLKVTFRSNRGITTVVFDTGVLARAAVDGYLELLARAAVGLVPR